MKNPNVKKEVRPIFTSKMTHVVCLKCGAFLVRGDKCCPEPIHNVVKNN